MDTERIKVGVILDQEEDQLFKKAQLYWSAHHQIDRQPRVGLASK